jgi:hypothetical protein
LELPEIRNAVGPFDAESLVFPWQHSDPRVDALSVEIQEIAAQTDAEKLTRFAAFEKIWQAAHAASALQPPLLTSQSPARPVPFLSEPWYCCAEPTPAQFVSIGGTSALPIAPPTIKPTPAKHPALSADQFV